MTETRPNHAGASGPPRRGQRRSRRRSRIAIGVIVLAGAAVVGAQAAASADAGRRALEEARQLVAAASHEPLSSSRWEERLAQLDRAEALTERAIGRLSGWPLGPLGRLPLLGRDIRTATSIGHSGRAIVSAARDATVAARPLAAGRIDGATIKEASAALIRLERTIERAIEEVTHSTPLILTGSGRRGFLVEAEAARRSAEASGRALDLASSFYAPSGSVRYFLAFQNPAELRGTGGLIGQYGILESSPAGPRLTAVEPIGTLGALTAGSVAVPTKVADRYRRFGTDRDWTAVNVPPDFPTVGRVIVDLYSRATGRRLDGVVAVDPLGAAKALEATGPIAVDGARLNPGDVPEITMVRAYQRFAFDNAARSRFLSDVARGTFASLVHGLRTSPIQTIVALAEAAKGRHVQAYAVDPVDQRAFAMLGIAGGASPPRDGDYVMPVGVNVAGNKLDAFLRRSIRYEVRILPNGDVLTRASLTLRNDAPSRLPEYVQGPHDARFRAGENRQFQTLYLAGGYAFTSAALNGRPTLAEAQFDLGALALSQEISIGRGDAATLAYELRRTGAARIVSGRMTYRVLVRPQATATPDQLEIRITAPPGWRFLRVPSGFHIDEKVAFRDRFPLVTEDSFEFVLVRQ